MWTAARLLWAEPDGKISHRAGRHDRAFAAVVLALATAEAVVRPDVSWRLVALGIGVALAAAVWVRRRRPLLAVIVAFGPLLGADLASAALGAEPVALWTAATVLVVVYALLRWGSGREIALGAVLVALEYSVAVATDSRELGDAGGGAAVLLLAAAMGLAARFRALALEQLVERSKLEEREQLARELHDTVAHHVSAIATQAQAGLVLARASSPGTATDALRIIEQEATLALAEMRTMVRGLRHRSGSAISDAGHRLNDIENLATSGDDQLSVDVVLRGDLSGLGPSLESTLYRAAQESVTNARRHAHGATKVTVAVTCNATEVQLTVEDDGEGAPTSDPPGFGLIGMAERVRLLGGEFAAGPHSGQGWLVCVVLPRDRSLRL